MQLSDALGAAGLQFWGPEAIANSPSVHGQSCRGAMRRSAFVAAHLAVRNSRPCSPACEGPIGRRDQLARRPGGGIPRSRRGQSHSPRCDTQQALASVVRTAHQRHLVPPEPSRCSAPADRPEKRTAEGDGFKSSRSTAPMTSAGPLRGKCRGPAACGPRPASGDARAVIPVARNVSQHVEGGSPAAAARRLRASRRGTRRVASRGSRRGSRCRSSDWEPSVFETRA